MRFHHIGVATANLEKSINAYVGLGYSFTPPEIFNDPIQKVRIAFMAKADDPLVELVSPLDKSSPVNNILRKVRTSPYHTCYEVEDITETSGELQAKRFGMVVEPVEAVAFEGRRVCFLYNTYVGLVELLEANTRI